MFHRPPDAAAAFSAGSRAVPRTRFVGASWSVRDVASGPPCIDSVHLAGGHPSRALSIQSCRAPAKQRAPAEPAHMLMTRESFCTRLSSKSPCLIVAWYCAFFVSGRVDETMPLTLSIEHESRPPEMNWARSMSR